MLDLMSHFTFTRILNTFHILEEKKVMRKPFVPGQIMILILLPFVLLNMNFETAGKENFFKK